MRYVIRNTDGIIELDGGFRDREHAEQYLHDYDFGPDARIVVVEDVPECRDATTANPVDVRDVVSVEDGASGFVVTAWTLDGTGHPLHTFRYERQARQLEAVLHRVLATYDGFADPHLAEMLRQLDK